MDRSIATGPTLDQWIRHYLAARAFSRRTLLGGIGGLTGLSLLGCSSGGSGGMTGTSSTTGTTTSTTTTTATTTTTPGSCVLIPEETVGPYPLFIASAAAYQRADIKEGKTGVPLNLILNIVNVSNQCAPILTAMVYVWHCDKDGYYSGYNQSGADLRGQTFLRYLGLALQATSQLAFPSATTSAVYSTSQYVAKGQNPTTPSNDGIFSDGVSYQMPIVTANAATGGYDAELTVGIAA
jgi:hypothetical protein